MTEQDLEKQNAVLRYRLEHARRTLEGAYDSRAGFGAHNDPPMRFQYSEIDTERSRQDKQWGGPVTDDTRSDDEWCQYIEKQTEAVRVDRALDLDKPGATRERYIKIAALAVAAVESIDARLRLAKGKQ